MLHSLPRRLLEGRVLSGLVPTLSMVAWSGVLLYEAVILSSHEATIKVNPTPIEGKALGKNSPGLSIAEHAIEQSQIAVALGEAVVGVGSRASNGHAETRGSHLTTDVLHHSHEIGDEDGRVVLPLVPAHDFDRPGSGVAGGQSDHRPSNDQKEEDGGGGLLHLACWF